jgi:probable addiction module antidote protein
MTIELKTYDVAEHLDNEEEIHLYLEAAFEDGDPAIIKNAIANVIRARGSLAPRTVGRHDLRS